MSNPQTKSPTVAPATPDTAAPTPSAKENARARGKAPAAFRTISEVADGLGVQQHVLRFWETKFSQIRPLKRGGGRRYYRPEDVALLERIHALLYTEGYTIKGVQKLLKGQGRGPVATSSSATPKPAAEAAVTAETPAKAPVASASVNSRARPGLSDRQKSILESMLGELKELRGLVKPR